MGVQSAWVMMMDYDPKMKFQLLLNMLQQFHCEVEGVKSNLREYL